MTALCMSVDVQTRVAVEEEVERSSRPTVSMLSPHPPTACGLATHSESLERALQGLGHRVRVVRAHDGAMESDCGRKVAGNLVHGVLPTVRRAAMVLSDADVAIVQHAFDAYGGRDGEEVLDVIRLVRAPLVTVLHQIPADPAPNERRILEELGRRSASVVVPTHSARARVAATYDVPLDRVVVIPRGARAAGIRPLGNVTPHRTAQVLSWGLLRPGKGFETAIDAIAILANSGLPVRYTIAGMTHPREALQHGERYRLLLRDRACERGVRHLIDFDYSFRGTEHLSRFVRSSSIVVLPYDSTDQVSSGVLVDSLAARRPIVATRFPHAAELLSPGVGLLVDHDDAAAMAQAIGSLVEDHRLHSAIIRATEPLALRHDWSTVGSAYSRLTSGVRSGQPALVA